MAEVDAVGVAGAGQQQTAETNWLDADASTVTAPPGSFGLPVRVNGSASAVAVDPGTKALSAPSSGAIGRAYACSSPSKRTVPWASAAIGGTKRITVPARPQSMVPPATKLLRRGDLPRLADRVSSTICDAEGAQRVAHQLGVARLQPAGDHRRLRCQRSQDQGPVGLGFGPGKRHRCRDRSWRLRRSPLSKSRHPQILGVTPTRQSPVVATQPHWMSLTSRRRWSQFSPSWTFLPRFLGFLATTLACFLASFWACLGSLGRGLSGFLSLLCGHRLCFLQLLRRLLSHLP